MITRSRISTFICFAFFFTPDSATAEDTITIVIKKDAIFVGDDLVVKVDGGMVDPIYKGGDANSLVILPLKETLQTEVDHLKLVAEKRREKFVGRATIIVDPNTPYRLLVEVIFTAHTVELVKIKHEIAETEDGESEPEAMPNVKSTCPVSFELPETFGPTRLKILIVSDGFFVLMNNEVLETLGSCEKGQTMPTICLSDPNQKEPLHRYDWVGLYNLVMTIKAAEGWQDLTTVELVANVDISYVIVAETMDVVQCQLESVCYSSVDDFNKAEPIMVEVEVFDSETGRQSTEQRCKDLFPDVILGIVQ